MDTGHGVVRPCDPPPGKSSFPTKVSLQLVCNSPDVAREIDQPKLERSHFSRGVAAFDRFNCVEKRRLRVDLTAHSTCASFIEPQPATSAAAQRHRGA